MPEMLLNMAQTSLGGLGEMQKTMLERLGRMGDSAKAYEFQDLDENMYRMWTDIYEKEFKQFFHIPQLGLMRTYQEKANQVDSHDAAEQFDVDFAIMTLELSALISSVIEVFGGENRDAIEADQSGL